MVEGPNPRFPPLVKPRLEQNSQIFVRKQGRNQVGFHPDLANSQVFLASVFFQVVPIKDVNYVGSECGKILGESPLIFFRLLINVWLISSIPTLIDS